MSEVEFLPTEHLCKCENLCCAVHMLLGLTFVSSYDCNGSQAQSWIISGGSTLVQVAGTQFCLDLGIRQSTVNLFRDT